MSENDNTPVYLRYQNFSRSLRMTLDEMEKLIAEGRELLDEFNSHMEDNR